MGCDTRETCLLCKHFLVEPEKPRYSEYTPGDPFYMGCAKDHWSLDRSEDTQADFTGKMQTSLTCNDYKHYKCNEEGVAQ